MPSYINHNVHHILRYYDRTVPRSKAHRIHSKAERATTARSQLPVFTATSQADHTADEPVLKYTPTPQITTMLPASRIPRFQITSVGARNFRSISNATADLERLTVFVGPNASGKSNVLDILRFIKDALRFDLDAAISMRHGIGAIHHERTEAATKDIDISISTSLNSYSWTNPVIIDYGFSISTDRDVGYRVNHEFVKIWQSISEEPTVVFRIDKGNLIQPSSLLPTTNHPRLFDEADDTDFDSRDLALPTLLRVSRGQLMHTSDSEDTGRIAYQALNLLYRNLMEMRFYHMFPNTIREPQKLATTRLLDENAGNLASVLRTMERRTRPDVSRMSRLKEYLARLVPGISDLEVTSAGGYLVVRLKHDSVPGSPWIDLSLESDGTVRLLGILTALSQDRNPPLIGIEEPELTVHPGALSALADVLHEAARTSQILVTTHSPDFIDCITQSRTLESVRIVELVGGVTKVDRVPRAQVQAVRQHLFSPGELHRMGDLQLNQ